MTRLFVVIAAAIGAYLGIVEVWAGSKATAFVVKEANILKMLDTYEGFPVSYQLLATGLAIVMALCVGR